MPTLQEKMHNSTQIVNGVVCQSKMHTTLARRNATDGVPYHLAFLPHIRNALEIREAQIPLTWTFNRG
ncbi:MAG: hypothetical protein KDA84_07780, partial [Planctomycetaceae bacterium]|nr:hypothetical protein [Planctomycetaceae bacterium]